MKSIAGENQRKLLLVGSHQRENPLAIADIDKRGDAVLIKDMHDTILWANDAAGRMFGASAIDMVGTKHSEYIGEETYPAIRARVESVSATGTPQTTYEIFELNGVRKAYLVTRWPFCAADGAIVGTVTVARSVVRRTLAYSELHRIRKQAEHPFNRRIQENIRQQDIVEERLLALAAQRTKLALQEKRDWIKGVLQRGGTVEHGPHFARISILHKKTHEGVRHYYKLKTA